MSLPETLHANNSKNVGDYTYDFNAPSTPSLFPPLLAPSMTSIFPTFSSPDINFYIFLFGARYRYLVRRWNSRLSPSPSHPTTPGGTVATNAYGERVNFAGMALNQFYAAVRKALVVAIVLRATVLLGGTTAAILWLWRQLKKRRSRLVRG